MKDHCCASLPVVVSEETILRQKRLKYPPVPKYLNLQVPLVDEYLEPACS